MKVFLFLVCSQFSIQALANFSPAVGSRPHTVCWEKQNRFAGINVYLTDLRTALERTQVEIKEVSQRDERQVLLQTIEVQVRDAVEVYEGESFRLEISRKFLNESSQRPAHLVFLSESGEEISRDLLCDSLMYPMGTGQASF